MKYLLPCLFAISIPFTSISQTIQQITLRPGPDDGIDAGLFEHSVNSNFGNTNEFITYEWTFGGTPSTGYSLLKFDLSALPPNATILNATLSLYYNGYQNSSAGHSGDNESYLKRVIDDWSESTVTWANQPSVTAFDQVALAKSINTSQDYDAINLTKFVKFWYNNPDENYGMKLQIVKQDPAASMKFCSSDAVDSIYRPKLVILYQTSTSISNVIKQPITISPNPTSGNVNIELENLTKDETLVVVDILGKVVLSKQLNENVTKYELQTSNLADGSYYIVYKNSSYKFIKSGN